MRQNFIKFRKESVQLARVFESASDNSFDTKDIAEGTLAIGTYGNGTYPSGKFVYEPCEYE